METDALMMPMDKGDTTCSVHMQMHMQMSHYTQSIAPPHTHSTLHEDEEMETDALMIIDRPHCQMRHTHTCTCLTHTLAPRREQSIISTLFITCSALHLLCAGG